MLGAGSEVEITLPCDHGEYVAVAEDAIRRVPRESAQCEVVAQTARMMDEVTDGDALAVVGHLGDVFPDIVVERDLPILRQEGNGHRRELLRIRPDVEDRSRSDRNVVLQVGHTVSARIGDLAIANHGQGAAR
jgi:hypothetical protein